jgi:hypothetical protein
LIASGRRCERRCRFWTLRSGKYVVTRNRRAPSGRRTNGTFSACVSSETLALDISDIPTDPLPYLPDRVGRWPLAVNTDDACCGDLISYQDPAWPMACKRHAESRVVVFQPAIEVRMTGLPALLNRLDHSLGYLLAHTPRLASHGANGETATHASRMSRARLAHASRMSHTRLAHAKKGVPYTNAPKVRGVRS